MFRVLVFGADGLLGRTVTKMYLDSKVDVFGTSRRTQSNNTKLPNLQIPFNVGDRLDYIFEQARPSVVVNCVVAKDSSFSQTPKLFKINSIFPRQLAEISRLHNCFLIQCSSDAVFPNLKHSYTEHDRRFPLTKYGISKMYGEFSSPNSLLLRFSMVGTRLNLSPLSNESNLTSRLSAASFGQVFNANQHPNWNGVTTNALSKLIVEISKLDSKPYGIRHFFTSTPLSKLMLMQILAHHLFRQDLNFQLEYNFATNSILSTTFSDDHSFFWSLLGYKKPPNFLDLIDNPFS